MEILSLTALTIGLIHTAAGPDHYVPFIALSRAGSWTLRKTIWVTVLCGLGHLASSVVIGLVGVAAGYGISQVNALEEGRGTIAAWLLIGFGLAYAVWGIVKALRPKAEQHLHTDHHGEGVPHFHDHRGKSHATSTNVWMMFIIFVFGPCEPLIPLVMFPAAKGDYLGLVWVTVLFGIATIATMLSLVLLGVFGVSKVRFAFLERYNHAIAGLTLVFCGVAIEFLGL
jgi:sulfite exporter TauE/SafE